MGRMAWRLRREGGGARVDEEGAGGLSRIILSFSFCLAAIKIRAAINCTTTGT